MEGPPENRTLRASDADREQVAELLRQAAAYGRLSLAELHDRLDALYQAKTYGELEPVVADLPAHYTVKAIFGGAELDLRQARLESTEVTIDVKAVFGGVDIAVPDDVIAIVDGMGIFGGFDDKVSTSQPAPGSPVVRIAGKAVFGGVSVHRAGRGGSPGGGAA